VTDVKVFGKAFTDPYYIKVIKADEVNFLDTTAEPRRTIGPLKMIVDGGKAVIDVEKEQKVFDEFAGQ